MDSHGREVVRGALAQVGASLGRMLRQAAPQTPVVGSEWRLVEAASHVAIVLRAFAAAARGDGLRELPFDVGNGDFHHRLALLNAALIGTMTDPDPARQLAVAVDVIEEGLAALLDATATLDPAKELHTPWYGPGMTRTTDTLTALALGEVMMHGLDMARTTGVPWPIERSVAMVLVREIILQMTPLMPTAAGRDAAVSYRISWRGAPDGQPDLIISFGGGVVNTRETLSRERTDCRLWARPVGTLLLVYGRSSVWRQAFTGNVIAWGRRPHAATRLTDLLCQP